MPDTPMDPSLLVDTLADLFPHKSRSELYGRLVSCDRIDVVIDDLIQEQEHASSVASSEIRQLQLLFPGTDSRKLERVLKENENDVELAIEAIMLKDASVNELGMLTGLLEAVLEPYLQKNPCRMLALADIMCNYRKKKKVKRSRVQDSRNASSISIVKDQRQSFDESGKEISELRQLVYEHQPLQQLNFVFLVKCLEFFEGAVDRVLRVAYMFVDHDVVQLTYEKSLNLHVAFKPELKAAEVLKQAKLPQKSWTLSPSASTRLQNPTADEMRDKIRPPLHSALVDLHGLMVGEAVDLAKQRVIQWWAQETEERQAHGILSKFGSKAQFVDPLEVIVGRGLHSSGGPKLRKPVMKMLDSNNFIYREEIGRFSVLGKRT